MDQTQTPKPKPATPSTSMSPETQDPAVGANGMQIPAPIQDGSPYFSGPHALVRFSTGEIGYGPEVFWLVDKETKTITPFVSPQSLQAVFGPDFQAAMQGAVTVVPPNVASDGLVTGGVFDGFYILGPEYAIQEDGSGKKPDFTPGHLAERYGRPADDNMEQDALTRLDSLLSKIKQNAGEFQIPPNYIDKIMKDHRQMAFYLNAMAYGDYEDQDVLLDIIRRFHVTSGSPSATR